MSTYSKQTKHPVTGEWHEATWIDDFYSRHNHGVEFPDGQIYNPNITKLEIRDGEPVTTNYVDSRTPEERDVDSKIETTVTTASAMTYTEKILEFDEKLHAIATDCWANINDSLQKHGAKFKGDGIGTAYGGWVALNQILIPRVSFLLTESIHQAQEQHNQDCTREEWMQEKIKLAEQEMLKRVNKELDKMRQSIKGEFTNEETKLLIELFGKAEYPHYYQERMYGYNQGLEDTKKIINNLLK